MIACFEFVLREAQVVWLYLMLCCSGEAPGNMPALAAPQVVNRWSSNATNRAKDE